MEISYTSVVLHASIRQRKWKTAFGGGGPESMLAQIPAD